MNTRGVERWEWRWDAHCIMGSPSTARVYRSVTKGCLRDIHFYLCCIRIIWYSVVAWLKCEEKIFNSCKRKQEASFFSSPTLKLTTNTSHQNWCIAAIYFKSVLSLIYSTLPLPSLLFPCLMASTFEVCHVFPLSGLEIIMLHCWMAKLHQRLCYVSSYTQGTHTHTNNSTHGQPEQLLDAGMFSQHTNKMKRLNKCKEQRSVQGKGNSVRTNHCWCLLCTCMSTLTSSRGICVLS